MTFTAENPPPLGSLVTVGPKYVMAVHPPYGGRGYFEPDPWTGRTFRVVAVRVYAVLPPSAALADPTLLDVDETDEIVDIVLRRLSPAR